MCTAYNLQHFVWLSSVACFMIIWLLTQSPRDGLVLFVYTTVRYRCCMTIHHAQYSLLTMRDDVFLGVVFRELLCVRSLWLLWQTKICIYLRVSEYNRLCRMYIQYFHYNTPIAEGNSKKCIPIVQRLYKDQLRSNTLKIATS